MENPLTSNNEQEVTILKQWQTPEIVKIEVMGGFTIGPESSAGALSS